ncbi:uncharacterized protein LOC134560342 [Prinia subflava]|uniref:uncharacterized protein LOC134560342 n=1 Tax=Prinia subflava TaxID=208062 RepID=UPI002FE25D80
MIRGEGAAREEGRGRQRPPLGGCWGPPRPPAPASRRPGSLGTARPLSPGHSAGTGADRVTLPHPSSSTSVHSKRPAASRSLLQFTPTGPPLSHGDQWVPAGSRGTSAAAPGPAAPRAPRPPRWSAPSAPRQEPESLPPSAPAPHLAPRSAPTRAGK